MDLIIVSFRADVHLFQFEIYTTIEDIEFYGTPSVFVYDVNHVINVTL